MRRMNSKLALVGAVALAGSLFLTASAHAYLTLTENAVGGGIPLTLTDFNSPPGTPGVASLSFPKFNMAGTLLQSVTLALNGNMDTTLTFQATPKVGADRTNVYVYTMLSLVVQDAGNNLLVGGSPATLSLNPQFQFNKGKTLGIVADGASVGTSLLTTSDSTGPQVYTSAPVLAEFTGAGNLTLNVATLTTHGGSWTGGAANISGIDHAAITGTITYTYEYSAVPEATTLLLSGMAAMPILMQRRRQRGVDASVC